MPPKGFYSPSARKEKREEVTKMDRRQMSAAGVAVLLLALAAVTAQSQAVTTPLYNIRMDQATSKMNFSPVKGSMFTYTTVKGCIFMYNVFGGCANAPQSTESNPCPVTNQETCQRTCLTCPATCLPTCPATCGVTCDTCVVTCGSTCPSTCDQLTCGTCGVTCSGSTCFSCSSTCSLTCSTCFGC